MWKKFLFNLLFLGLCSNSPLFAQEKSRAAILPDHVTAQYAGSLGLGAAGFGYRNSKNHLEAELLGGYLPESHGDRLFTLALKTNWIPIHLFKSRKVWVYPIQTGFMTSYTFGEQFFGLLPDYYPEQYYTFSTAIHAYWQIGSRISVPIQNKRLEMYYEFNASAEEIVAMIQNPNFLGPGKIFNLAIGVKLNFEP